MHALLAFAAPVVSFSQHTVALTALSNLPQTAAMLTISGVNFASFDVSPTAYVESAVSCASSTWNSATSLGCRVRTSGGGVAQLLAAVALLAGSAAPGLFTFDGI